MYHFERKGGESAPLGFPPPCFTPPFRADPPWGSGGERGPRAESAALSLRATVLFPPPRPQRVWSTPLPQAPALGGSSPFAWWRPSGAEPPEAWPGPALPVSPAPLTVPRGSSSRSCGPSSHPRTSVMGVLRVPCFFERASFIPYPGLGAPHDLWVLSLSGARRGVVGAHHVPFSLHSPQERIITPLLSLRSFLGGYLGDIYGAPSLAVAGSFGGTLISVRVSSYCLREGKSWDSLIACVILSSSHPWMWGWFPPTPQLFMGSLMISCLRDLRVPLLFGVTFPPQIPR